MLSGLRTRGRPKPSVCVTVLQYCEEKQLSTDLKDVPITLALLRDGSEGKGSINMSRAAIVLPHKLYVFLFCLGTALGLFVSFMHLQLQVEMGPCSLASLCCSADVSAVCKHRKNHKASRAK